MLDDLGSAFETYNTNIQKAFEASGLSIEDFASILNKALNGEDGKGGAKNDLAGFKTESEKLVTDTTNNVKTALETLTTFFTELATQMGLVNKGFDGLKDIIKETEKPKPEEPEPQKPQDPAPTGPTWEKVKAAYDKINQNAWGTGRNNRIKNGNAEGFTEEEVLLGQQLINLVYGGKSLSAAKSALGFDTGGYTGA